MHASEEVFVLESALEGGGKSRLGWKTIMKIISRSLPEIAHLCPACLF